MADIPILGGNTDTRSNIKNLWASVNTISNYLSTGGGANMTYVGTDGSIGKHYKQSSIDGKSCTDSRLYEDGDNFDFGGNNLISVDTITANTFVKNGGTLSDFLKADGSIDSNAYLTSADLLNYVPKVGDSTITGNLEATSFIKTGGTSSEFLKADGSSDSSRIYIAGANLAIGPNSLISNTSGIGNEAIGYGTLKDNTEGNYNNAVGVNALMNNTTGSNNMAIGLVALYTNITGNNNTAIGYRADVNSDNLSNAMALGSNAKVSTSNTIQLGDGDITTVNTSGNITANSFVKNGGTNQQYLMADGSTLEASANSGNSNIYLYNNISYVMTPPLDIGDIGYNNINQANATIVYISHLTRNGLDIERYYNDLTDLNYVYIQDQSNSTNFIKYTITGTPTIIINEYISIPVAVEDSGGNGATTFGNNHNIMLSFFSNLIEIDQRITTLEGKTQNQTAIAGNTNFSSGITIGDNYITTTQGVFNASGQLVSKNYVDTAIGIGTNNTTERWVNSYIGVDTNSGSIIKPLQTINAGFSNSAQYPLKLNIRGVFTVLQTLTATNANTQITTTDGYEAQQSTLSATVITSGTLTRLKMSGFTITTGASAVLTFGDTLGRHTFSNMQFVSSNATPITFNAGFTNWCNFQDCDFTGLSVGGITLPNLTGTAILRLYNCGLLNLITGTGWTVYISGSTVLATSSNLATGTIIQLPINQYNAVLTVQPTWASLAIGNYINMVGAGLTGVIGTPSTGCCVIKIATGVQVVSLGYNQLPSSISVLNGSNYDTYVRTSGAVGWVVVNPSAYLPTAGGTMTGAITMGGNAINTTIATGSFTGTNLVSKNYTDATFTKCPSEQLKIIRGNVNSAGGIVSGAGFTSLLIGGTTSQYRISFTGNPFAGTQIVSIVATPSNTLFASVYNNSTNNTTNQFCEITFGNASSQVAVAFSFIAIGT